jgi:hypothetical protein
MSSMTDGRQARTVKCARRGPARAAAGVVAALLATGAAARARAQQPPPGPPPKPPPAAAPGARPAAPAFQLLEDCGIDFVHHRFATPFKKYACETAGSGVGLLDYDGDGRLDVYCVQCCPLPGYPAVGMPPPDALYHNDGRVDGRLRFHRVADRVVVTAPDGTKQERRLGLGDIGYGMGVSCPDVDNDGDPDLFVTNVGRDVLYRNNGDGTFTDVTDASGVLDDFWSAPAAWADLDGDGDLDLYLGNYALIDFEHYKVCATGLRVSYCAPKTLSAAPDRLFRNDGGFHFTDVTREAGVLEPDRGGKALAVIPFDFDDDGRLDLYVANDTDPNFLWHNVGAKGELRFEEIAGAVGLAVNGQGSSQSCMGSDIADVDGDLRLDVLSANFGREGIVLYRRTDCDFFDDVSFASGLAGPSYLCTGFGLRLFDYDRDADLDLMVVNGHVLDDAHDLDPNQTFEQCPQFFENRGDGTFVEIGARLSPFFRRANVARGLAVGDLDEDGDEDAVVLENDHALQVLENVVANANHSIAFKLVGTKSPRDAIGARVRLACGDKVQVQEVHGSASYLSWQDLRLHFGVGARTAQASARITWPSGQVQELTDLALDTCHTIVEPK